MNEKVAGLTEIADALGVHVQTVKRWCGLGYLTPYELPGSVSGSPAYNLAAVLTWHAATPPKAGRPRLTGLEVVVVDERPDIAD